MKPKCVQCVYGRSGRCINCDHPAPWLTTRRGFISMLGSGLLVAAVPELITPVTEIFIPATPGVTPITPSEYAKLLRPGINAIFTKVYAERGDNDEWQLAFKTIPMSEVYR